MQKRYTVRVENAETGTVERQISDLTGTQAVEQRDAWAATCEGPWVCKVEVE